MIPDTEYQLADERLHKVNRKYSVFLNIFITCVHLSTVICMYTFLYYIIMLHNQFDRLNESFKGFNTTSMNILIQKSNILEDCALKELKDFCT